MPSLSPTMTEGTIVKWNKQEGDKVAAGDVVCEIQTDKAVVAMEVDEDGTLAKILKLSDSGAIEVGTLIAVLAEDGEDWTSVAAASTGAEVSTGVKLAASGEAEAVSQPSGGSTPGTEVKMPSLSPTMTEGTIVKWCIKEGEKISAGDVLCEIQTDKAVVSMEVDDDAILAKILFPEGSSGVKVGDLIALTVEEGQDWKDVQIPGAKAKAAPAPTKSAAAASPTANVVHEPVDLHFVPGIGPATNLLLAQYGLEPSQVPASGPKGLVKGDVMKYILANDLKPIAAKKPEPVEAVKPAPAKADKPAKKPQFEISPSSGYTDRPLSSMRSVIAKRLCASKSTSPHGYATLECNIDHLNKIRADYARSGLKISVNDLLIKAVGTALQHVPQINLNTKGEDDIQVMTNIDISVAVATPNGLITPIVKNVPSRSLDEIANVVKDLAGRAREGRLMLDEFQGGTFTISNLGMFGIKEFTAIINPPQCAILAVGSGRQEIDGETGLPFTAMSATLSFDRRFIDEALASDFMSTLQKIIEQPEYMNIGLPPVVRNVRTAMQI